MSDEWDDVLGMFEGWEDVIEEIKETLRKQEETGEIQDNFASKLFLETFGWERGYCEKPEDVELASKAGLARWEEELERRKAQSEE